MSERTKGFGFSGVLILTTFLIGRGEAQANCHPGQDVDLRSIHPEIFKHLPITDQGSVGVCYAHAASTLIDFYRLKLKSDQAGRLSVNPLDAAQVGTLEAQDGNVEGGQICDVVNGMSKRGYGYVSTSMTAEQAQGLGLQTQVQAVQRVYVDYIGSTSGGFSAVRVDPEFYPRHKRKKLSPAQQTYLSKMDGVIEFVRSEIRRRGIQTKATDTDIFAFIQDNHGRNDYTNFPVKFELFLAGDSKSRESFSIPHLSCKSERGRPMGFNYMEDLDRALELQKAPVGLNFCANVLKHKNYDGHLPDGTKKSDCQGHAVLVIGRRLGKSGCEYLLRNSWGPKARGYAWPVDAGDIWVAESALFTNLFGISVVHD